MKSNLETQTGNDRPRELEFVAPDVNIFENQDGYVLVADMPGVGKDGLEISLDGNEITMVGRRDSGRANGAALVRERREANYRRVFELDPAIDTGRIATRVEQGVLTLVLPKSERVKPRQISVE